MNKAIIIGASSGIGKELALVLDEHDYELGLMARRLELLEALKKECSTKTYVSYIDVTKPADAVIALEQLIQLMGGVDLIIINSGVLLLNPELDWSKERQTIEVNVSGFCALAGFAYRYFAERGSGQLVGISSIGALMGSDGAPAYNASKAFMSNYLEGLRKKAFKDGKDLTITDIKPGYVETDMIAKNPNKFWVATAAEAAEEIYSVVKKKKTHAYITRRWRWVAWLLKCMPEWMFLRL